MPTDIETQVRGYAEFFVTTVEPVTQEEIARRPVGSGVGQVRPIDLEPRPAPRRGWLVSVAVAAAVVLIVGGGALLVNRTPHLESPGITTPATASFPALSWTRASLGALDAEGRVDVVSGAVLTDGTRLVGVGWTEFPDTGAPYAAALPRATVWTSSKGNPWSRVADPGDADGFGAIERVVAAGPGYVAAGTDTVSRNGAVWVSSDGLSWTRVSEDDDVFGRGAIYGLTVGGPGLVAVGLDGSPQAVQDATPAVWTSRDGIIWSRVPNDPEVFGPHEWISAVFARPGGLLAIGNSYTGPGEEPLPVLMWASSDGVEWTRVTVDDDVFGDGVFASLTPFGDGVLAVGGFGGRAAVWTSTDGITWSRIEPGPGAPAEGVETWMSDVAVTNHGLVAVGSVKTASDRGHAVMWTSSDGITWDRVPFDESVFGGQPEVEMAEIVSTENRLYIIGVAGSGELLAQTIWTATFDD